MESVIWAFKQLWDKGLAYEGYRVLPYCWNDETPLSSHELRMDDDVYQSRQDPAITVGFKVTERRARRRLPVGLDDDAVDAAVQPGGGGQSGRRLRAGAVGGAALHAGAGAAGGLRQGTRRRTRDPGHLHRRATCSARGTCRRSRISWTRPTVFRCCPPTSCPPRTAPASCTCHRPTARTTWRRRQAADIVAVTPVDSKGRFDETVPDYAGQHVFDANPQIIRDLKNQSGPAAQNGAVLLRHETYEHSYPHCWRCRNPLIYRAVSSWFVKVTEFRDRMVEINQDITWYPEHVKDGQFGKWLQGARDWSISRNRYWGTPDSGVGLRRSGLSAHRRLRQPRRTRARLRGPPDQPAPALHRRADSAEPRRPDRPVDDAAHPRRVRRVVRLRLDAVRAGALPVRECRLVRRCHPRP